MPFNEHVAEYEDWYERYPFVFQSEVEAIRELLPVGENIYGIEVALGTGKFSEALSFSQTLFHNLDDIKKPEPSMSGYGKGSLVMIKSLKKRTGY